MTFYDDLISVKLPSYCFEVILLASLTNQSIITNEMRPTWGSILPYTIIIGAMILAEWVSPVISMLEACLMLYYWKTEKPLGGMA